MRGVPEDVVEEIGEGRKGVTGDRGEAEIVTSEQRSGNKKSNKVVNI